MIRLSGVAVEEQPSKLSANLQASADAAAVMKERDQLQAQVKRLEAARVATCGQSNKMYPEGFEDADQSRDPSPSQKPMDLVRKLAEKQAENKRLQVCK